MRAVFNIRHLDENTLTLKDELTLEELDIETLDVVIHVNQPLAYDLEVQRLSRGVLVRGILKLTLDCECVRCLKSHQQQVVLENWTCHLPLEGEDKVEIINDLVDLTPFIREDIVLAFPQHPLCEPGCKGLSSPYKDVQQGGVRKPGVASTAWAELNKLKLKS